MTTITNGFLSATINGLSINKSYPCNSGNYTNKSSRSVSYVVMHYTGNVADSALSNCKYFQNNGRKASSHFFVDDSNIYQSVELRDVAWHCGCSIGYKTACRNANSFGIEMCTSGNYLVSEKTQINAAYLCAYLCKMIGITANTVDTYVIKHFDAVKSNKRCPAQYVSNPSQWIQFKTWVKNILNTGKHVVTTTSNRSYLMSGDSGTEVKTMQENLIKVGYSCGSTGADGNFGSGTETAVKAFQADYGLTVDGKYGSGSKTKMTEILNLMKNPTKKYANGGVYYDLVFNPTYYTNHYSDLKAAFGTNATKLFDHYINYGLQEGRQAVSYFNVQAYKSNNYDLRVAFGDKDGYKPYVLHYLQYGKNENRKTV